MGDIMREIVLNVNGKDYSVKVPVYARLVDVLREQLEFTDVKLGCGEGECGTCTILLDGKPVDSCMILAVMAERKTITTVRGISKNGKLHPLQDSFMKHGAIQCGYCTPGMILTSKALLDENPTPTEKEIKAAISGNMCRCTGYQQIAEAIKAAGKKGY
jgi:carbon-monoxide dehydrogenase small subunit